MEGRGDGHEVTTGEDYDDGDGDYDVDVEAGGGQAAGQPETSFDADWQQVELTFDELVEDLNSPSQSVRLVATRVLGESGDPRALTPLSEALGRETEQFVAETMQHALAKLRYAYKEQATLGKNVGITAVRASEHKEKGTRPRERKEEQDREGTWLTDPKGIPVFVRKEEDDDPVVCPESLEVGTDEQGERASQTARAEEPSGVMDRDRTPESLGANAENTGPLAAQLDIGGAPELVVYRESGESRENRPASLQMAISTSGLREQEWGLVKVTVSNTGSGAATGVTVAISGRSSGEGKARPLDLFRDPRDRPSSGSGEGDDKRVGSIAPGDNAQVYLGVKPYAHGPDVPFTLLLRYGDESGGKTQRADFLLPVAGKGGPEVAAEARPAPDIVTMASDGTLEHIFDEFFGGRPSSAAAKAPGAPGMAAGPAMPVEKGPIGPAESSEKGVGAASPPAPARFAYCPGCGQKLASEPTRFCPYCGLKMASGPGP